MKIILVRIQELHLLIIDMGTLYFFAGIKGFINDHPGSQILELDLDPGLLRCPFLMKLQTAKKVSIDFNRDPGLDLINGDGHNLKSIPALTTIFKSGRMTRVEILVILGAYLLGSIPFGLLISRIWKVDIRTQGSGNIGATNVLRVIGPIPALIVFILDAAKGAAPVFAAAPITQNHWFIIGAGVAAMLGHSFPLFLKFKGGRGVATGVGVLLGIAPLISLSALLTFGFLLALTRYVSISSMLTSILVGGAFLILKQPLPYTIVVWLGVTLILIRHVPNIKRLIAGTEPKIGEKK